MRKLSYLVGLNRSSQLQNARDLAVRKQPNIEK